MKISVCGKGGSGKSTVVTLLAKQALRKNLEVLVVDADDSNAGMARMLGFDSHPLPLMELVGGKAQIKKRMGGQSLLNREKIQTGEFAPDFIRRRNGLMLVGNGRPPARTEPGKSGLPASWRIPPKMKLRWSVAGRCWATA